MWLIKFKMAAIISFTRRMAKFNIVKRQGQILGIGKDFYTVGCQPRIHVLSAATIVTFLLD